MALGRWLNKLLPSTVIKEEKHLQFMPGFPVGTSRFGQDNGGVPVMVWSIGNNSMMCMKNSDGVTSLMRDN